MHQSDDSKPVDFNGPRGAPKPVKSLASLTGWENEIAFRLQCKQIIKDSGLEGLVRGLETISACFKAALEVYEEEVMRNIKTNFKKLGDNSNEVK